jgi:exopolysaccharide biosynthesis polyprenyl glycosylphosphotransferase
MRPAKYSDVAVPSRPSGGGHTPLPAPGRHLSTKIQRRGPAAVIPPPLPDETSAGWMQLARLGVQPLLVGLDVFAVGLGVLGMDIVGRQLGADASARQTAAFGAVLLVAFWLGGLHRSRLSLSLLDDLPRLIGRWLVAGTVAVVGQIAWSQALWQDYVIDRTFLGGALAIGVLVVLLRSLGYALVRSLRSRGLVAHRTLVLGAGRVGSQVAEILQSHPEYGLHPIGFLDGNPPHREEALPLPLLGGPESLQRVLREGQVHNVVVAFSSMKESEMVSLIRTCDRYSCELFVVPRLFELQHVDDEMDTAWGLPLVRLRRATYRSAAWRVKRVTDVAVAGVALVAVAPLLAILAVAVRLDGGPGILFRQERVGVDGRHFQVLKFRSLRPATDQESQTRWNIALDDRLTALGRFLRKSSLDELPQLFNILRGDMSLVGPRPERPHFVSQFRDAYPSYEARHRVPSGLTGWAQVHGLRGDTSIADRARFDNYYIENWSLWLDVKIMLRTVSSVLRGSGR